MRESELESRLRTYAKGLGFLFWKFAPIGIAGVPDRVVISPCGEVAFLELKAKGKKPRKLQLHRMKQLTDRNVKAGWVDSFEDGKVFIDDLI